MKAGKNKELDYLLINLCQQPQPPNWQQALEHRERHSLRQQSWTLWGIQQYYRYGPGVSLYFALLKNLIWMFLLLVVASLPALLVNFQGNGLSLYGDSMGQTVMRFSLANQPTLSLQMDKLTQEQEMAKLKDIRISQIILVVDDILCSIVFICFMVYWQLKSEDMITEMVKREALPSYHTILVELPKSQLTPEEVRAHFEKFGTVRQIQFVYDYGAFLLQIKDFLNVVQHYSEERNWIQREKLYDKIEELYLKIKERYISAADSNVVVYRVPFRPKMAFVSFDDPQLANRVRGIYRYGVGNMGLQLDGNAPKVSGCHVEPLSIIWQNYHMPVWSEMKRSWLFGFLVTFILLVTLFAIFLMSLRTDRWGVEGSKASGDIDYQTALNSTSQAVVNAFCAGLTYKNFQWKFYQLCSSYFTSFEQHWVFVFTISCVTVCINVILIKVINVLAELRRFRTIPQQKWFMIVSIFLAYFFSSSLLVILIRGQITVGGNNWSLVGIARQVFPSTPVVEVYHQAGRKWYLQIGKLLLMNYVLTLNLCPWVYIVEEWLLQKIRELWAGRALTQRRMKERIMDREFYWQFYNAVLLNAVYFCLIFSMAMPLFYLLALVSIVSLFITSKFIFHKFTQQPHVYDHKLNSYMMKAIGVALVLHQLTSNYFLNIEEIFPQKQAYILSKTARDCIYVGLGLIVAILAAFPRRIASIIRKKADSRKEELMITEEINSSFGAGSREMKTYEKVQKRHKQKIPLVRIRKGNYLNSYKMQDNPYYNSISYTLLILNQTIIQRKDPDLQLSKQKQQLFALTTTFSKQQQRGNQSLNEGMSERALQYEIMQSERVLNQSI